MFREGRLNSRPCGNANECTLGEAGDQVFLGTGLPQALAPSIVRAHERDHPALSGRGSGADPAALGADRACPCGPRWSHDRPGRGSHDSRGRTNLGRGDRWRGSGDGGRGCRRRYRVDRQARRRGPLPPDGGVEGPPRSTRDRARRARGQKASHRFQAGPPEWGTAPPTRISRSAGHAVHATRPPSRRACAGDPEPWWEGA